MTTIATENAPRCLAIEPAAKRVGLGRTTMYQLITSGEIRSILVGRRRLIPVEELDRWLERKLAAAGEEPTSA